MSTKYHINEYDVVLNSDDRIPKLVKISEKKFPQCPAISYAEDAVKMIDYIFQANLQVDEHCYMIAIRTKDVIGVFEICHGGFTLAYISPKDILMRALLAGATGFILLHNHPSGYTTPSRHDIDITGTIAKASNLMDIDFIDHIIIGKNDDDYYSFTAAMETGQTLTISAGDVNKLDGNGGIF